MRSFSAMALIALFGIGCAKSSCCVDTDLDRAVGEAPAPEGMPTYWQMDEDCLCTNDTGICEPGGAGDFIYFDDGTIRHFFWYGFQGFGTGGVGGSLSLDGGHSFNFEPGLRLASTGVLGQWDFHLDQSVIFTVDDGWRMLLGSFTSESTANVPNTSWLFESADGLHFVPLGPAIGAGSSTDGEFGFVGRGSVYRDANGTLRALITCNRTTQDYAEPASDVCAMTSSDDGETWEFDTNTSIAPWFATDRGDSWEQDETYAGDSIVFADGNETYVFTLPDGRYAAVFTYLIYGMFGSTSDDGITWSAPKELDIRHSDGETPCEYHDPDGDGMYTYREDPLNCDVGDMAVLQRADGSLAIISNTPPIGMVSYTAVW